ncbi:enolase C-terminal domain-like protein [Martelella radicis]|uniref:L-alanine-DL-glutamate epimerase-like enolase superfamily enzyme n=1 Tax=Martelella radicis TaxID=1397476 RepID=A0A7W6PBS6_9HYPH|nr:enolase C-terminal domain-like protein [Martelella radicis]MBB4123746.1 L-alanine-DL-glutamate epimerase-like enolase superfamily enzyme [Martelella radicis]
MKIQSVETWQCRRDLSLFPESRAGNNMPWDVVVLKVTADTGAAGYASALAARSGAITEAYLHETIAPVMLGRDPYQREAIWHDLWNVDRHLTFFPVYLPGPVDVALWDLAAREAGQPLYRYLGAYRDRLPAYASGLFHDTVDEYVEEAKHYKALGLPGYKAHPPCPWRKDIEVHRAVREAVGPDYLLFTDPVGEYTLEEAIRVGRDLEKLDYVWFEEPFRDFELQKYQALCQALDIPIAATETTRGAHWGVAQVIAQRAADIVRADVSWKAGITGTMKIAHMAEAFGLKCEIHTTTMAYMDIANLHASCAIKNCDYFELFVPQEPFVFPMKGGLPIDAEGNAVVPDSPGLGVDLDWDEIDRLCVNHRVSSI